MNIKAFVGSMLLLLLFIAPAASQPIKNAVPDVARPLPLSSVRITGGPLKRAQDLNAEYLLKLEPDRMMAYYRKRAVTYNPEERAKRSFEILVDGQRVGEGTIERFPPR